MNVDVANKVLEQAREHQDRFSMGTWYSGDINAEVGPAMRVPPCGTVGCFAGFAAFQTAPDGVTIFPGGVLVSPRGEDLGHVETFAKDALGLTWGQVNVMFYLDTLEEVEEAVKYLTANPDASEDELGAALGYI